MAAHSNAPSDKNNESRRSYVGRDIRFDKEQRTKNNEQKWTP
jgi:hypothetical protein